MADDLIIRGGQIVAGSGREPVHGDLAIDEEHTGGLLHHRR